jgi:hypothetical protein
VTALFHVGVGVGCGTVVALLTSVAAMAYYAYPVQITEIACEIILHRRNHAVLRMARLNSDRTLIPRMLISKQINLFIG